MMLLRGKQNLRIEQKNLNNLFQAKKVRRIPYLDITKQFGGRGYVYTLDSEHSLRTLDHELDITDYHIRLKQFCNANGLDLIWQQKHMTGKFYPDAYFCIKDVPFFLEIERQHYGNVKNGKPSIIRKADSYYDYFESPECKKRWGFTKFHVIFQLKEINPDDFLTRLKKHKMYWIGTPGSLTYHTPRDPENIYSFSDI